MLAHNAFKPIDIRNSKDIFLNKINRYIAQDKMQIKSMSNPFFQVDNENMDISDLSAIFTTQYQTHEVIIIEVESCKIGPRPEGMPRYWPILYKDKYLWNFINVSGKQALKEQGILNYNERQLFVDDFHDSIKIHGKSIWLYMFSNLDHLYRESLPALYLIKQVYGSLEGFNIVTPHISEDLVILLEGLGVKRNKIIQVGNTWIEFDNVIITSFPSFGHLHTPSDYYIKSSNNLSESFSKLSNITQKHKIFISRRNATQRKIHNEIDLYKYFEEQGYYICDPGDYTPSEQIALFSHAEIIVGSHGMGIANAVFSKNLKILIEIMPTDWNRVSYYRTTQLMNCKYGCYWIEKNEDKELTIDVDRFVMFVEHCTASLNNDV